MADRKQGDGRSSGSSAAVHKANCSPGTTAKCLTRWLQVCVTAICSVSVHYSLLLMCVH